MEKFRISNIVDVTIKYYALSEGTSNLTRSVVQCFKITSQTEKSPSHETHEENGNKTSFVHVA